MLAGDGALQHQRASWSNRNDHANCSPESEPVASTTILNCSYSESFSNKIVLTPNRLMSLSFSGFFPTKATLALASLTT